MGTSGRRWEKVGVKAIYNHFNPMSFRVSLKGLLLLYSGYDLRTCGVRFQPKIPSAND